MTIATIADFPRERLAHLPTPLEPLRALSNHLGGPQIYVKRDDCTGLATGGNKTRKLEFLVADALRQGADTLITAGAVQSNHARQTAAAAARFGLRCELVLARSVPWRDPGYETLGNVLYDRLLGARLHFVAGDVDRAEAMRRLAERLRDSGARPYVIPVGGSCPLGALGYVECAAELLAQTDAQGLSPDALVLASGSGGTQAGLVVGCQARGAAFPVIGVCDETPWEAVAGAVRPIADGVADLLGAVADIDWGRVEFLDSYAGPAYGVPTAETVAAISLVARLEGLLLDPVYSGKAMAGLIGLVRQGRFREGQTVLFLHTGGSAALDAYPSAFVNLEP